MALCHASELRQATFPVTPSENRKTVQFLVIQYNLWTAGPMLGNALAREILC